MEIYKFKCWCEKAASGIIFPPDRDKVYQELMDHMEDHCDALMEQGMDKDAAQQAVVEAMGDPWPIAKQLAAIHRPFWGYFLRVTRVILVIALLVTVIPLGIFIYEDHYGPVIYRSWGLFDPASYGGDTGRTLLYLSSVDSSEKSDGYTYTLTDAVYLQLDESGDRHFYFEMVEFHPLPWAVHGKSGIWFWAEDSLGNIYHCDFKRNDSSPVLYCYVIRVDPFSYTYGMWINEQLPEDAQWLDVRYTREGRNMVFRIDLTGGNTP